jgi:hypothetical protein
MLKLKFKIVCITILLMAVSIVACRKDKTTELDTVIAEQESLASVYSDDIQNFATEAYDNGSISELKETEDKNNPCTTVTKDTINRIVTIDFGTNGCIGRDGRTRKGKIIINYSQQLFWSAGCTHNISFDNYFVNNNQITGTKTVTILTNGRANRHVESHLNILLANNGGTIIWNCDRTRNQTSGINTANILDDEYSITGAANGTSSNGTNFVFNITNALIRKMICPRHFVQGVIVRQVDNRSDVSIDFGNGDCDWYATVSKNGVSRQITLR